MAHNNPYLKLGLGAVPQFALCLKQAGLAHVFLCVAPHKWFE